MTSAQLLLSDEQGAALSKLSAASDSDRFITDNLGLVHSCCHRFQGRGIEYDDLYQAGCLGLVKSAQNFDASRGLCFSTYAVPVILGEIKRLFRDGGTVKVGRTLKERSLKASRVSQSLAVELGREPSISEVAAALGVSAEEAAEALCAARPALSLSYCGDGEEEHEIEIPGASAEEETGDRLALNEVMDRLEERDRKLIHLRYFESKTQTQTAEELGMTQVQVSRRERVILGRLRELLNC